MEIGEVKKILADYKNYTFSLPELLSSALNAIRHLENDNRRLGKERNAAVADLSDIANQIGACRHCKDWNPLQPLKCDKYKNDPKCWNWRGVQEVKENAVCSEGH